MWSLADANRLLFEVDHYTGHKKWETIQLSFPSHSVHSCKRKYYSMKRGNWTAEELNEANRVAFTPTPALENKEGDYLHEVLQGLKTIKQCKAKIRELRAKKKLNKPWTADEMFVLETKQTHLLQRSSSSIRSMRLRLKQKGHQELYTGVPIPDHVVSMILDNSQCSILQALYREHTSVDEIQAKMGVSANVIEHYVYKLAHGVKLPPYELMMDLCGYYMQFKNNWTHISALLNEDYDNYPVSRYWCRKEIKYLSLL